SSWTSKTMRMSWTTWTSWTMWRGNHDRGQVQLHGAGRHADHARYRAAAKWRRGARGHPRGSPVRCGDGAGPMEGEGHDRAVPGWQDVGGRGYGPDVEQRVLRVPHRRYGEQDRDESVPRGLRRSAGA